MIDWTLRIASVALAFWLSHTYIVAMSGGSLSPVATEALEHEARGFWWSAQHGFDGFEWIIFSPLAVGFVIVAALAFGLVRSSGR